MSNPPGWTMEQLDALNRLVEMRDIFNAVKDITTLTNDASPEATRVKNDLIQLTKDSWSAVKKYQ